MRFFKGIVFILCLVSLCPGYLQAQNTVLRVKGEVRDSLTHQPVPFTAIFLAGTQRGALTDDDGRFDILTAQPFTAIKVSVMGYDTKTVPVSSWRNGKKLTIDLVPTGVKLKEVVIKPKKEKYSKKNNPAVDFVTRIRKLGDKTDPKRNDYYSYDKYERITLALNNFNPLSDKNLILKKMRFLKDYVDTSEISGKSILNLSTREKSASVYYRRTPESEKEYVEGLKMNGLDDFADNENMLTLFEDMLREIDLYQGQIPLFRNHFVSPLSKV
ncbi:MAG: carboxypeptidase-like regulatory domain-containing protein, partial [Paramuribaculum sp.]|nr:carboxypeptidase-like regulatory domain-containing protein [Paramuribaculum sp.]